MRGTLALYSEVDFRALFHSRCNARVLLMVDFLSMLSLVIFSLIHPVAWSGNVQDAL